MISDSSHFLNVRHSFVHSSVWSQELKLGPSNPPIWKWDVFWSDKRSSEVIFFGTRTFYLFILYCVNESFSLLDRRTRCYFVNAEQRFWNQKSFFFLSVPKDDAVIKCWNTPSLISHMLHIHILLWCSIYYAWFKLHYKLMHFNTRTFNKVHFIQRTYFAPDNSEKRYLTLKVGFCPYFLLLSFLRHPVPVDYRKM